MLFFCLFLPIFFAYIPDAKLAHSPLCTDGLHPMTLSFQNCMAILVYAQTQGILQAKQPLYQLCYVSGFSAIFKFIHTWISTHTLGNVVKVQLLRPSGETAGLEGGLPDTGIQIISQLRNPPSPASVRESSGKVCLYSAP